MVVMAVAEHDGIQTVEFFHFKKMRDPGAVWLDFAK